MHAVLPKALSVRCPLGTIACSALAAVMAAGCGSSSRQVPPSPGPTTARVHTLKIRLSSPAFAAGGRIPKRYACPGNTSPPLRWSGVPAGTRELTLEMVDIDAPGGHFVHWALAGIPPHTTSIAAGDAIPYGTVAARNSFGTIGYGGPCPPPGKPHRYVITLVALAARSRLRPGFSPGALRALHALASGELAGTDRRRRP